MKERGLLHRSPPRAPELHQATKLFELLPQRPNDLWQMDVTYIHIPGHGWWYAVTVIDYYSRYLLACHITASYSAADVASGIDLARAEAERVHGPLAKPPFLATDNGSCFLAHRFLLGLREICTPARIGSAILLLQDRPARISHRPAPPQPPSR
jgi:transposase InsO family protein